MYDRFGGVPKDPKEAEKSGDPEESKVNDLDSDEDLSVGIHTLPKTGQIGGTHFTPMQYLLPLCWVC